MELTFWNITGFNLFGVTVQFLQQIILTRVLLGKAANRKRTLIFLLPYNVFLAAFGAVEFLSGIFAHVGLLILHQYLYILVWCAGIRYIYKENWKNAIVTSAVVMFLVFIMEDFTGFFVTQNYDLSVASDLHRYIVLEVLGAMAITVCAAGILRHGRVNEIYSTFLYGECGRKGWRVLLLLLPVIQNTMIYLVNEKKLLNNSNPVVSLLSFLLMYGVFHYVFRCELQKKQITEQNAGIRHQELYIQNLESVQREMRLFRHDYKNMMSGIYLQAEEGNLAAVQSFINQMTEDFDRQVGEKICQMTQLGNIKIPELKGLLAAKLVRVQSRNIKCSLEVWEPVEKISMPVCDLCRAIGILLDNAAEAVEEMETPTFTCMITTSRECTTILIKNPVSHPVLMAEIWKEGYSTKGEGRGLGLASYRRIMDSYENVFSYTYEENGIFIQELKIRGEDEDDTNLYM